MTERETPSPAIELSGVSFTYRNADSPALSDATLRVAPGEFVVLMGRTGAGKSTLCQCINGLIPRFHKGELRGDVCILGEAVAGRRVGEMSAEVGMVFQDFEGQLFSTRVDLEVAFGPENLALPPEKIARRVRDALEGVGLSGFEGRDPATLSGGEKQRLAIAAVLAMQPRVLVLDEPTTDIDPAGKQAIFQVAARLRDAGTTLLMVEHETEEVLGADSVTVMRDGRIVAEGPPAAVLCSDVDSLPDLGVRPPDIAAYFHRLGIEQCPADMDAAVARFHELGLGVSPPVAGALTGAAGEVILDVEDLVYAYPSGNDAVRGVSLSIREGEFLAIVGQNGCGKTTLVKHLNGLLRATSGQVRFRGQDAAKLGVGFLGRRVGYVFQNPDHQIFAETVLDEVSFGPRNFGLSEDEVAERVAEALEAVDLAGFEDADPFALTKGERQRVAVASVLATHPEVLILDEPTTGLDYPQQRSMMEMLHRLNEAGHTIIIVTHSMWVVAEYAQRCIVMAGGEVLLDAPTREAFADAGVLRRADLRAPRIVEFARRLGTMALSPRELAARTERRGGA